MQLFLIVLAFAAFFAYALWSSRLGRPGGHYRLVTAQTVRVEVLEQQIGPSTWEMPQYQAQLAFCCEDRSYVKPWGPLTDRPWGQVQILFDPETEHWYPVSALQSRKAVILSFALLLVLFFCLACACKLFPRLGPFLLNHLFAGLFFLAGLTFAVGAPIGIWHDFIQTSAAFRQEQYRTVTAQKIGFCRTRDTEGDIVYYPYYQYWDGSRQQRYVGPATIRAETLTLYLDIHTGQPRIKPQPPGIWVTLLFVVLGCILFSVPFWVRLFRHLSG